MGLSTPDPAALGAGFRQMYVNGKWTDSSSGETFEVINPATETVLSSISAGSTQDVDRAVAAFKQYREAGARLDGFGRFELFEQIGRAGHFAIVETWRDQKAFDARGAQVQARLTDALKPIRVSDYDQRPYKPLSVASSVPAHHGGITVVAHVDVAPNPRVAVLLQELAQASRRDPGNLRFDVYQHTMRANHFTVVETWQSEKALDQHVAAAHTKQYRDELQPMTGSPLDERVYRAVE